MNPNEAIQRSRNVEREIMWIRRDSQCSWNCPTLAIAPCGFEMVNWAQRLSSFLPKILLKMAAKECFACECLRGQKAFLTPDAFHKLNQTILLMQEHKANSTKRSLWFPDSFIIQNKTNKIMANASYPRSPKYPITLSGYLILWLIFLRSFLSSLSWS